MLTKIPQPNKGYVFNGHGKLACEHRRIAIEALGRELASDEVVHHINFNSKDNSIKNLLVIKRSEHLKLHRYLDKTYDAILTKSNKQAKEFIKNLALNTFSYLDSNHIDYIWLKDHWRNYRKIQCQKRKAVKDKIKANQSKTNKKIFLNPFYIRKRRAQLGLTQLELSHKSGINSKTICAIENGRIVTIKSKQLLMLSEALECKSFNLLAY